MTVDQLLAMPKGAPACEQRCGRAATVYALDPMPGGWGGRYCEGCATALRFRVTDQLQPTNTPMSPAQRAAAEDDVRATRGH